MNVSLYVQDAWKATQRFTVNAGVRWEPYFPQIQRDKKIYNFSMAKYLANEHSSVYVNGPAWMTCPGDSDFPGLGGHYGSMMVFAPRVGFGFDPRGDGTLAIRASYGLTYDFVDGQYHLGTKQAPPWGNDIRITPSSFDDPWAEYPGGNPFPYVVDKNVMFVPNGLYLDMDPHMKKTYVQTWNLSVERNLPAELFLRVNYQGSNTHHLWFTKPLNPAVYFPGSNCTLPNGRFIAGTCSTISANNTDERRLVNGWRWKRCCTHWRQRRGQLAVRLQPDPYAPGKPSGPRATYLNSAAFAVPPAGTLAANRSRNNVLGPGTWQWDAALSRIFAVGEAKTIEARVEAFNVPNSFRPLNPDLNITGGTFGQINTALPTRDIQFALKYIF